MNYRTLISILAFIILCFFANKWYLKTFCCGDDITGNTVESNSDLPTEQNGPIINKWNSEEVVTTDKWTNRKNEIFATRGENDLLEIIGGYYVDEENPTQYENLGIARAENAKLLLTKQIDQKRIKTIGSLLNGQVNDKSMALELVDFRWVTTPAKKEENSAFIETRKNEPLPVALKKTLRFPYKSAEKLNDKRINDYLLRVVSRLKDTKEKVYLVGHTDTKGGQAGNEILGMERAHTIRDILISYGLNRSRIICSSKGKLEPIADDSKPGGPEKNRRVELTIK